MIYYLYGDDLMNDRGIVIKSIPRQSEKYRTVSDPTYIDDLYACICKLFICAREKRNIKLKHRTNRSSSRTTNQNKDIQGITIIDLMNEFLAKKDFRDTYSFPKQSLFMKEFFRSQCSNYNVSYDSFYYDFKRINDAEFIKRYKKLTFSQIALGINSLTGGKETAETVESDYRTINLFYQLYRSRN